MVQAHLLIFRQAGGEKKNGPARSAGCNFWSFLCSGGLLVSAVMGYSETKESSAGQSVIELSLQLEGWALVLIRRA